MIKSGCILALSLILIAFAFVISGSNEQKTNAAIRPPTNPARTTDHERNNTQSRPKIAAEPEAISETPANQRKDKSNQNSPEWYAWLWESVLPNWLAVTGWTIAALIALRTLSSINRQVKANQISAEAARDANRIAAQALIITQRARIIVDEVNFFTTVDVTIGDKPGITYKLVNTGELPATGIFKYPTTLATHLGDSEPKRDLSHIHAPNPEGSADIIDPHSQKHYWWSIITPYEPGRSPILNTDDWNQILNGEVNIHIGICVAYWDGFHNTRITESWHSYNLLTKRWERIGMYQD